MIYIFEEWELDVDLYELRCVGKPIKIEPQVFNVLTYLVLHRDRVVSKPELLSHLWPDQFISDSALERCIMTARKAFGDSRCRQHVIKTYHRRGYRFVAQVEELSPAPGRVSAAPLPTPSIAAVPALALQPLLPSRKVRRPPAGGCTDKQVTALACTFTNSSELSQTVGPTEFTAILEQFFNDVDRYVEDSGGIIGQFIANGFVALFGVSSPCDDDALRAVQTAVALQEGNPLELGEALLSEGFAPHLQIGLHTGNVVGKHFGDNPQGTYMAVGEMIQFVSALHTCIDPGYILASGATYRLIRQSVQAELAGLIVVEPESAPIRAYRVDGLLWQDVDNLPALVCEAM